ncbi:MAG TPA: hypothetical protein VGM87_06730 [Roseomonas sp.]
MTLEELAGRCEEAAQGDLQLDAEIAAALGHTVIWDPDGFGGAGRLLIEWHAQHPQANSGREPCPRFTGFLDGASVLLQPRCDWMLTVIKDRARAEIRPHAIHGLPQGMVFEGKASQPPLALAAAGLRFEMARRRQSRTG